MTKRGVLPFSALRLNPSLARAARELGFETPTPIQEQAIPPALDGRDLVASAMTGSGKTAAFALPILHRLAERPPGTTRVLVLTPTRELAAQIDEHFRDLGRHTRVRSAAVFGGVAMGPQEQAFRRGNDVIVATPGRLLDHMRSSYAALRGIEIVVIDEADRMLDMGFLPDVKRVLGRLPARRQTLLFSATMPAPIQALAREMLREPVTIALGRPSTPPTMVNQAAYPVPAALKPALLAQLVRSGEIRSVIAFTRTKHRANRLAEYLEKNGVAAGRIHGNRSQSQRTQALGAFKAGKFPVLVATDIAARGIDIDELSHVINFDVPASPDDYVHRVGRTARAQSTGDAFLFVSPEEEPDVRGIERAIGRSLPRLTLAGFDYTQKPATHRPSTPQPASRHAGQGRSARPAQGHAARSSQERQQRTAASTGRRSFGPGRGTRSRGRGFGARAQAAASR